MAGTTPVVLTVVPQPPKEIKSLMQMREKWKVALYILGYSYRRLIAIDKPRTMTQSLTKRYRPTFSTTLG